MKPLHDRILVKVLKTENTKNGIILPNSAKDKNIANILKIGSEVKHVAVGNTIKYHEHCGIPFEYEGEKVLFIRESEVIAIL